MIGDKGFVESLHVFRTCIGTMHLSTDPDRQYGQYFAVKRASPTGTAENSPAIHRWETNADGPSPARDDRGVRHGRFCRPWRDSGPVATRYPPINRVGYFLSPSGLRGRQRQMAIGRHLPSSHLSIAPIQRSGSWEAACSFRPVNREKHAEMEFGARGVHGKSLSSLFTDHRSSPQTPEGWPVYSQFRQITTSNPVGVTWILNRARWRPEPDSAASRCGNSATGHSYGVWAIRCGGVTTNRPPLTGFSTPVHGKLPRSKTRIGTVNPKPRSADSHIGAVHLSSAIPTRRNGIRRSGREHRIPHRH
jgi:hypothetical protein